MRTLRPLATANYFRSFRFEDTRDTDPNSSERESSFRILNRTDLRQEAGKAEGSQKQALRKRLYLFTPAPSTLTS